MSIFLLGILWGLFLTILIGPIFFALIQTGIEQGFRAGFVVGLGIWMSDLIFILGIYYSLAYFIAVSEGENFELYLGLIGGTILISFGLGTFFSKPPNFQEAAQKKSILNSYPALWLKGMIVNAVNPFTVIFWIGVMSSVVVERALQPLEVFIFFAGILGTIIFTDCLKVYLAKEIRKKLAPKHFILLRKISGSALLFFGILLIIRVLT